MGQRVAVVVVHGVADQAAGSSARSVVDLLIATSPSGASYATVSTEEVTLPVTPLQPRAGTRLVTEDRKSGRPGLQELKRSYRPDLARSGPDAGDPNQGNQGQGAQQARPQRDHRLRKDEPREHGPDADEHEEADRGITLTDALLRHHAESSRSSDIYRMAVLQMKRDTGSQSPETRVDVFEMYWADLSRLSGSVPRIVSEIFTLIFRLARLGRETVAEAATVFGRSKGAASRAWPVLGRMQGVLDWFFVHVLATLTLHLALLGAVLLGLGLVRSLDQSNAVTLAGVIAGAAAVAAAYWLVYAGRLMKRRLRTVLWVLVVVGAAAAYLRQQVAPWVLFLVLLAAATAFHAIFLRLAAERFSLGRAIPLAIWYVLLAVMALSVAKQWWPGGGGAIGAVLPMMIRGVILGIEWVLFAMKWLWIMLSLALAAWFIAGILAGRTGGYESQASITTGRLGFGAALAGFLMLTMVLWAVLSQTFQLASTGISYQPCLFSVEPQPPVAAGSPRPISGAPEAARACLRDLAGSSAGNEPVDASTFLQSRYYNSTGAFSLVALMVIVMLAYPVAMLIPSILAESRLLRASPRTTPEGFRLGQWLTHWYRFADTFATGCLGIVVVLALLVAVGFYDGALLERLTPAAVTDWVARTSQTWLKPFVFSAAGLGATLIVFGGFLSRRLPALRGPLDIALDVDNHFRRFPADAIPRARIFSRFAAVLTAIADRHAAEGYDRIVIVAHSQGTVISAELLRYLCSDGRRANRHRHPVLGKKGEKPLPPIHLATFGCPLRQLYAARFPTWYRWVLAVRNGVSGPRHTDVGAARWANAFCAGDYIGRWLWSEDKDDRPRDVEDVIGHPMLDHPVDPKLGRANAYESFVPWPPVDEALGAATHIELCLGFGAHTHYFDIDQADTAWLIDHMIATPWQHEAGTGDTSIAAVEAVA